MFESQKFAFPTENNESLTSVNDERNEYNWSHNHAVVCVAMNHHHHHHLAIQPFAGFQVLSQVPPSSSVLSCFLPAFYLQLLLKSSMTSSCHRCLGIPTGLIPIGFQSNSFLVGLAWFFLCIWLWHLILCALMYLSILFFLLKALQLQRSFGLLNEFFPFGSVSDAVPPVCYP